MVGDTIRTTRMILITFALLVGSVTVVHAEASLPMPSEEFVAENQVRLELSGGPSPFLYGFGRISGETPHLTLAQRAIERDWSSHSAPPPQEDPSQFTYVEVDGWRSPVAAGAMSVLVPGSGQVYTGHKYGFIMMGVQAVALYSYFHYSNASDEKQTEAFAFAGDPNVANSNWSFERYEQMAGVEAASRLREIHRRDPIEFYSLVSSEGEYFSGWAGATEEEKRDNVVSYRNIDDERQSDQRKANFGLFAAIANSAISMVDAVRQARLNNFQLQKNLSLQIDGKTGRDMGAVATLTHKFH